jgi:hypothetical protein
MQSDAQLNQHSKTIKRQGLIIGKSVVFDSLRMLPSQALAIKNPIGMLEKSKDKSKLKR